MAPEPLCLRLGEQGIANLAVNRFSPGGPVTLGPNGACSRMLAPIGAWECSGGRQPAASNAAPWLNSSRASGVVARAACAAYELDTDPRIRGLFAHGYILLPLARLSKPANEICRTAKGVNP
jgi:hypothetical protein